MKCPFFLALLALLAPLAPAAAPAAPAPVADAAQPQEQAQEQAQVAVLGYGRLGADGLPMAEFVRQMNYLHTSGIRVISLPELLAWKRKDMALPERCVLITFDEAGQELAETALPLLRHFGFPCVVFVDERNLKGEAGFLSPQQLQRAAEGGASLGSHTMTRPSRRDWEHSGLSGEKAGARLVASEMDRSATAIRELVGQCEAFSYPEGYADPLMLANMLACGYRVAFSRLEGKLGADAPSFMLHRYMVAAPADFARAVHFGPEAELPSVLAGVAAQTAELPPGLQPVVDNGLADDDFAEDVEEELIPCEGNPLLARCGPGGDWVTVGFAAPLVPREQTRVAVLGYHNFSNTKRVTDMLMRTSEFCTQMQYIRDAGLAVISMQDFLEWKQGCRLLPARCVLITIDDGWRSVYTDAYPVLKAYGYPFTLFLYTRYINVQGDSLTMERLQEMIANGATIGSHSTNHLYPRSWRRLTKDAEAYAAQVTREIVDSRTKLQGLFGPCSTYCYPGGYNTPPMQDGIRTAGYAAAFTVLEAKVAHTEPDLLVHRYMILGRDPRVFRRAVNFDGQKGAAAVKAGIEAAEANARTFFPDAFPEEEEEE